MKLIIFDMDGTLVDTVESYMLAVNEVLEEEGFSSHPLSSYQEWIGGGISNFVRQGAPTGIEESQLQRMVKKVEAVYVEGWHLGVRIYPEIKMLLAELCSRGIAVAVNTNKVEVVARRITKTFFPETDFLDVLGEKPGYPNKPDPWAIEALRSSGGFSRDEVLFVGDSEYDIETARRGKVQAVGVTWGYREVSFLTSADILIDRPLELLDHLQK